MGERPLPRRTGGPVLALHHSIIRGWSTEGDSISLVISAHSSKGAAAGYPTFEVVNVGRFQVRTGWLIVAAILVEPRNWEGIRTAIRSSQFFSGGNYPRCYQRKRGQHTSFQHLSTISKSLPACSHVPSSTQGQYKPD